MTANIQAACRNPGAHPDRAHDCLATDIAIKLHGPIDKSTAPEDPPMTGNIQTAVRLPADAVASIDARAAADARTRSDMLRLLVAYALTNMPTDWRP